MKANECFICGTKLQLPGILGWFQFWRSPFHFAATLVLLEGKLQMILVPLCSAEFDSMQTNREAMTAMIEAKLIAKGDI